MDIVKRTQEPDGRDLDSQIWDSLTVNTNIAGMGENPWLLIYSFSWVMIMTEKAISGPLFSLSGHVLSLDPSAFAILGAL